jgi:heme A synthase
MAMFVAILALFVGMRAWGEHRERPAIPYLGRGIIVLVALQLILGTLALWATSLTESQQAPHPADVILTTAHQTVGAVILTLATMLALWTRRLLRSEA